MKLIYFFIFLLSCNLSINEIIVGVNNCNVLASKLNYPNYSFRKFQKGYYCELTDSDSDSLDDWLIIPYNHLSKTIEIIDFYEIRKNND